METLSLFLFVLLVLPFSASAFPEEENGEENLHEGDIRLSIPQQVALELYGDPTLPLVGARGLVKERTRLWTNLVVPYIISSELDDNPVARAVILSAMQEWEESSCLRFVQRTNEPDYLEFFKGSGCWSYVGRVGGLQQVSLASGCWSQGTVVHEIGHAMGFWHEQSRPDRDNYVEIIWDNIPEEKRHNFRKYNNTMIDSLGVPYDYLSVMHYSATAFGRGRVTIRAKDPSAIQLGQRLGLYTSDVQQADLLYRCGGRTTRVPVRPSPPKPHNGPDDCTFENGRCGFINVGGDDFDWTQRMGGTPSGSTGPGADHTTLRFGYFMYIETSSPRVENDTAVLQSKLYPAGAERCLQFYYHMYGSDMGSLSVTYTQERSVNDQVLWSKSGDQGDQWLLAKVQLPSSGLPYRFSFEGVRGSGYRGDAAIDDVFFTDGNCPSV